MTTTIPTKGGRRWQSFSNDCPSLTLQSSRRTCVRNWRPTHNGARYYATCYSTRRRHSTDCRQHYDVTSSTRASNTSTHVRPTQAATVATYKYNARISPRRLHQQMLTSTSKRHLTHSVCTTSRNVHTRSPSADCRRSSARCR